MSKSDSDSLESWRVYRDNLLTALLAPETVSAFGGMPDKAGGSKIKRMAGRAELRAELQMAEARIEALETGGAYVGESQGVV